MSSGKVDLLRIYRDKDIEYSYSWDENDRVYFGLAMASDIRRGNEKKMSMIYTDILRNKNSSFKTRHSLFPFS